MDVVKGGDDRLGSAGGPPADAVHGQGHHGEEDCHQETHHKKKIPHTGDTNSLDRCG